MGKNLNEYLQKEILCQITKIEYNVKCYMESISDSYDLLQQNNDFKKNVNEVLENISGLIDELKVTEENIKDYSRYIEDDSKI